MTAPRTYVAKRLLEHGPLTRAEFIEITGWPDKTADRALQHLVESRVAHFHQPQGHRRAIYTLTEAGNV